MLDTLLKNKETFTLALFVLLFFLAMNRASGIANLLRFLLRHLKFGYSDRKMKLLDERWFNIQLFRIINGINISRIEDARIIQKGLNEGFLKPSCFFLTSSWGDITKPARGTKKFWSYFLGALLLCIGIAFGYLQKPIQRGYAKMEYMDFNYYVSKEKLIIVHKNSKFEDASVHGKQDCKNGMQVIAKDTMFSIACSKLLNDSESYQWWLTEEINLVNNSKSTLEMLYYSYCFLGLFWVVSFRQFNSASKKVREYIQSQP